MTVVDEALQQPQDDRVADVQIRRGRVETEIDAQRAAQREALGQLVERLDVVAPVGQEARAVARRERSGHAVGERNSKTVTPPPPSSALP